MGVITGPWKSDQISPTQCSGVQVTLQGAIDLAGFRRAARSMLAQGIPPEQISWYSSDSPIQDLFAEVDDVNNFNEPPPLTKCSQAKDRGTYTGEQISKKNSLTCNPQASIFDDLPKALPTEAPPISVPPEFLTLCQTTILHSNPNRFGLLYRLLWRLVHEPALRHDPLDADMVRAQHLAQAVRRDLHKMKAFVRFRSVQDDTFRTHPEGGPLHVAWFEPEHHIVEAVAPFFARRFTQMRWAILTPERSVEWNGAQLQFGPSAQKADAPPPDAGERLWLTYYQNIFNPARLKLKAMQKEMPRRYWKNLPEAQLISSMAACASERQMTMIEQAPSVPRRRIPVFQESAAAAERAQATLALDDLLIGNQPLDLNALNNATQRCRQCPIGQHATQAVCGEGPVNARVMVVGEQPGDIEDLKGRPFVGPAGQLFDKALSDLGWPRKRLFITNAVKHFKYEPSGKRRIHKTPNKEEASACLHWLDSEIALVKPQAVIALGSTAASSLLHRQVQVMSERGQWFTRADGLRVLVTLHPAALLRTEVDHQDTAYAAWLHDLQQATNLITPQKKRASASYSSPNLLPFSTFEQISMASPD